MKWFFRRRIRVFNICTSYELIIPFAIPKTIISDPAVYPYFDIYRTGYPTLAENEQGHETEPVALGPTYPRFNICKCMAVQVQVTRLTPTFRSCRLPVLRHILYWIPYARKNESEMGSLTLRPTYPRLDICKNPCVSRPSPDLTTHVIDPAVYPYFDIYSTGFRRSPITNVK